MTENTTQNHAKHDTLIAHALKILASGTLASRDSGNMWDLSFVMISCLGFSFLGAALQLP